MTVRFKARGSDGRVAIWRDADDENPFDDPLDHLTRVLFHSELQYPTIIAAHIGTLSLPARAANDDFYVNHELFAHGLDGIPFVLGFATIGSQRVPFAGSVPIDMHPVGWGRWLNLGANETHVSIHEVTTTYEAAGFAAVDVDWTVYVTDTLL